jgi:uncharacterized protein involved in high-affinity Fe2+ transport
MVNYSLEEFKAWLEADESRKEGLPNWDYILRQQVKTDTHLEKLVKQENYQEQNFTHESWIPYRQVVLKWINEVDQRERERERERERANSGKEFN